MLQQVDVVDQVQIDRPGTLSAAPFGIEVIVRFAEPGAAGDAGDRAETPLVYQPPGPRDQRIVPPVMEPPEEVLVVAALVGTTACARVGIVTGAAGAATSSKS